MQVIKPLAPGAYVFNKVPVKHRLGTTSGNQPDSQHVLLSQSNATTEDVQVREMDMEDILISEQNTTSTIMQYINYKQ